MIEVFDKNNLEKELKPLQEKLLFIESVYINKVAMLEQAVRTLQRTVERLQERTITVSTPTYTESPFYKHFKETCEQNLDRMVFADDSLSVTFGDYPIRSLYYANPVGDIRCQS